MWPDCFLGRYLSSYRVVFFCSPVLSRFLSFVFKMKKASAEPAPPRSCANCGKTEGTSKNGSITVTSTLKDCSRCKRVGYCNKECQAEHWKTGGHREFCLAQDEEKRPEAKVSTPAVSAEPLIASYPSQSTSNFKKAAADPSTPECSNCGIRQEVGSAQFRFCSRC